MEETVYAESSDLDLVQRCINGDNAAWSTFVDRYETTIFFAVRHTFTRHGLEPSQDLLVELQAEVLFHLLGGRGARLRRFHGKSSLKHWIKVVARNYTVDYMRRKRPTLSLDDPNHAQIRAELHDPGMDPEARFAHHQAVTVFEELCRQLGSSDKRFLELFYERGMSHSEVARAMQTTVGAIYSRKNRVQRKLSSLLTRLRSREDLRRSQSESSRDPQPGLSHLLPFQT